MVAAAAALLATILAANSQPTVVAVAVGRSSDGRRMERLLRDQLEALGFEVVRLDSDPTDSAAELNERARRAGVAAVARIRPRAGGQGGGHEEIEVWVADRATGKPTLHEVVSGESGAARPSNEALALRAAELVRAGLVGGEALPVAAAPLAPEPAHPARWAVMIGPVIGRGTGEGSFAWSAWLAVRGRLGERATADAFASIPVVADEIRRTEGSVTISAALAGVGASLVPRTFGRFTPSVGGGIALAFLRATGMAAPPFAGTHESRWLAAPLVRAGVTAAMTRWLGLRAELVAALALPTPVIQLGNGDEVAWGRPIVLLLIAADISGLP